MTTQAEVAKILNEIYERKGELIPEDVVKAARPVKHPLHAHFVWMDDVAGELYRIEQARALIRTVKVKFVPTEEATEMRVRAWHTVRNVGKDGRGYVPDVEVRTDPDQREFLIVTMKREWAAMRRKYQELEAFWEMVLEDAPVG